MTNRNLANAIVCAGYSVLSAVALSLTVPVAAQEQRTERVVYGDLDLTAEAGRAQLSKRISAAVKRVCRPEGFSTAHARESRRCKRSSLAGATAQMQVAIARAGASKDGIAAMTLARSPAGKP